MLTLYPLANPNSTDVSKYGISPVGGKDVAEGGDVDDDFDLFGDDDPEEVKKQQDELKQKLIREAEERQKKKLAEARSTIVMEVKPYDDDTDMGEIEKLVRVVQMDGLKWGKSQLIPVAYGLNSLQITAVIYDEKVSTEDLCEDIEKNEIIQSADVVSFQKFS
ncbi:hypothetical protein LOD99_3201 [Oopsacas minuta]|uniref:Translation elongation factor EF1B beta/delta subunit guanine nucleotide exchange domain-containing protein n=1 Tax=Oopsacas minuta TaxID=111878 RepID=A0AAV7JXT9_9METZ|nr:hypothetical protein LOD99_3201 [Oopsacas minuta]